MGSGHTAGLGCVWVEKCVTLAKDGKRRVAVVLASRAGDGGVSYEGTAGISRIWGSSGALGML